MNGQPNERKAFRPWPAPQDRTECCAMRRPVLRAVDLGVDYGGAPALRDVNLTIDRGCITAIMGPSGCGKSTFLSTLNRMTDLDPGTRVHGDVYLDDRPLYGGTPDLIALRRRVGMIFQRPNPFPLTVRRNITFPLREHGIRDRAEQEDVLEDCLRRVGLWEEVSGRLDWPALELSGGQQQRLCLARALALRPDILLLDEPCSALDPLAGGHVEDLIAALRGDYTVVIVTHNLAQARRIADDVALFWTRDGTGTLIESGITDDLFCNPRHELTAAYVNGIRG